MLLLQRALTSDPKGRIYYIKRSKEKDRRQPPRVTTRGAYTWSVVAVGVAYIHTKVPILLLLKYWRCVHTHEGSYIHSKHATQRFTPNTTLSI